MIFCSGNESTDLYTKTIISELFPEFCFSERKNIKCVTKVVTIGKSVKVTVDLDGEKISKEEKISDYRTPRLATTSAIGKAIIDFAKSKGIDAPPYGVLTGVRPFKIATDLISDYGTHDAIFRLRNNYLVSEEKISVLLSAAKYDKKAKEVHNENDCSIYISIPFCPTRCNYCSFISSSSPNQLTMLPAYVKELIKELKLTLDFIYKNNMKIKSLYIGGGTPTILSSDLLESLLKSVVTNVNTKTLEEFTLEAGRPDTITEEKLSVMKLFGVTRTCVNCQSTNDEVLKRIGRKHSADDFYKAFELVKKANFHTVNTDIIAGLDGENFNSFKSTLDSVLSLKPENITVHTLCIKKSADIKNKTENNSLKNIDDFIKYSFSSCILNSYSPYYLYKQKYSVGNHENIGYCTEGHESHYNIAMMNEIEHIFGIGAGATSRLLPSNPRGKIHHFANYKYPTEYLNDPLKYQNNIYRMQEILNRK
ncbi:MAG: coproporphyrinogen dehydrogenase HemZ [Ruminococcaceae bacterium]|nr:coproporphyrinogen dehydrogenase HemZ [Oscillospiraceae bacterium]